jgi:hypothetical protein
VARAKSSPSKRARGEDWLRRGAPVRTRPWALEELLLGEVSGGRRKTLAALEAELGEERSHLSRMEEELHGQALRISGLEGRLRALDTPSANGPRGPTARNPTPAAARSDSRAARAGDYGLSRCEGFRVDSPTRRIGVVEGLRFLSRIDQPDLLEVRAGLFGRQRLLIPVAEVDEVHAGEGRLVLRGTARPGAGRLQRLLGRRHGH